MSAVAKVTKQYFTCNIIICRSRQSQGHVCAHFSGSHGNQAVFYCNIIYRSQQSQGHVGTHVSGSQGNQAVFYF